MRHSSKSCQVSKKKETNQVLYLEANRNFVIMCTYANISLQGVAGLAKAQIRAGLVDASSVNARRVDTLVHVFTQKQHFLME